MASDEKPGSRERCSSALGPASGRRARLSKAPKFRIASLLGALALAAGAGGWAKYNRDLEAQELAVLTELAEAGCGVDATRSVRAADSDGSYGERRWYEPPFLARVRELRVSGDAPAELIMRAASLPALTRFNVTDRTWPDRERPATEVLGQPPPKLPPETLAANDFVPDDPKGAVIDGAEADVVLGAVRSSWDRERETPKRVLVHAFRTDTEATGGNVRYQDRFQTSAARDGERSLTQIGGAAYLYLMNGEAQVGLHLDVDDAWSVHNRSLGVRDPAGRFEQAYDNLAYSVRRYPAEELDPFPLQIGWEGESWRAADPVVRRLDDDTVRIDFLRTSRCDDEYAVTVERESLAVVVRESCDWLPIARRRLATVEGSDRQTFEVTDEAFRYASHDGRTLLTETLLRGRSSAGYRRDIRVRSGWDFDPAFDAKTFEPRRFVGPGLAEPGTYPFRWYRLPLFAGVAFIAVRLFARVVG